MRARIGLNSVHSVILLLIRENEKQARRADRPQAGVKRSATPAVRHNPRKRMGGRMENDEIINSDDNSLLVGYQINIIR